MNTTPYLDYILKELKNILAIDSPSGYVHEVADYVQNRYQELGYEARLTTKGGVLVDMGGADDDNGVLLEAHIDTLGAIVSQIKSNGRLKLTPVGGMNANNAEAENCRVLTRFDGKYEGTFHQQRFCSCKRRLQQHTAQLRRHGSRTG